MLLILERNFKLVLNFYIGFYNSKKNFKKFGSFFVIATLQNIFCKFTLLLINTCAIQETFLHEKLSTLTDEIKISRGATKINECQKWACYKVTDDIFYD